MVVALITYQFYKWQYQKIANTITNMPT